MTTPSPRTPGSPHHRLLFVCLGNICRSPLAEGVFLALAHERGVRDRFIVDSCGLGSWHAGEAPDPRALAVARKYGITLDHCARQLVTPDDFERFDLLLAMDRQNRSALLQAGCPPERLRLLRSFETASPGEPQSENHPEVPDPYLGGAEGFESVYRMVRRSCHGLLDALLTKGL